MSALIPVVFFISLTFYMLNKISMKKKSKFISDDSGKLPNSSLWYFCKAGLAFRKYPNESQLSLLRKMHLNGEIFYSSFLMRILIVSSPDLIMELNNSPVWADRVKGRAMEHSGEGRGIMLRNGVLWKELRNFSMKTISKLGLSKKDRMEEYMATEITELFTKLEKSVVETRNRVPVKNMFSLSTMNVMWSVLTGKRFPGESPEYIMLRDAFKWKTELSALKYVAFELFGNIIKLAPKYFGYGKHFEGTQTLDKYFREFIDERDKMRKEEKGNVDFTDLFLEQIELHGSSGDEVMRHVYTKNELKATLMDLLSTGMDTSKTAMEITTMFMCKYPNVQKKIQKEIESVVGSDRLPSYLEHASKMSYTLATLMEIRRIANILPFNVRVATQDYILNGKIIKKGTAAVLHLHRVNMDRDFWGDPDVFRPERFLDSEDKFITDKVNRSMAFGSGVRRCPGQVMATVHGFMVLTGLLQRYHLRAADESQFLHLEDKAMAVNTVKPFLMSLSLRT